MTKSRGQNRISRKVDSQFQEGNEESLVFSNMNFLGVAQLKGMGDRLSGRTITHSIAKCNRSKQ